MTLQMRIRNVMRWLAEGRRSFGADWQYRSTRVTMS